ncbi:MAG: LPXTG cell wall anchor domain-containing protein, partial [Oscillibacter sp.]|nr:LPXTG cell wall anchor domain-containing protein [Oscillibacter sp.]
VCTVCGETVKKGEVIPAPGHKTQLVGAKAATCTEDGYTGDEVCTVCQEVVKKGEVIPATGHDYKDGKCTNCGETDPNYKPAEPENPGVKTGDEAHTALWLAAASVSLLAAAALLLGKKKHLS